MALWVTVLTAAAQELSGDEAKGGYQLALVALVAGGAIASLYEVWNIGFAIWQATRGPDKPNAQEKPHTLQAEVIAEVRFRVQERLDYAVGEKSLMAVPMVPVPEEVGRGARPEADLGRIALWRKQVVRLLGRGGQAEEFVVRDVLMAFSHEHVAQKLLILGAPGSGKTTALLTLAKDLLEQCDGTEQFPYIFELSAWKDETQDMLPWMAEQLKFDYGIDVKVGEQWIRDRQLLPLLDGLDELRMAGQRKCVDKINAFAAMAQQPVVVCCRSEEYADGAVKLLSSICKRWGGGMCGGPCNTSLHCKECCLSG